MAKIRGREERMSSYFSKIGACVPSRSTVGKATLGLGAAVTAAATLPLAVTGALSIAAATAFAKRATIAGAFTRCRKRLPSQEALIEKTHQVSHSSLVAGAITTAIAAPSTLPLVAGALAIDAAVTTYRHRDQPLPPVYVPVIGNINPLKPMPDTLGIAQTTHTSAEKILIKGKEHGYVPPAAPLIPPAETAQPAVSSEVQTSQWREKTQRQVENISKKLNCAAKLFVCINWGCGIEADTQTLLNLSSAASESGASTWEVFRRQYPKLSPLQWVQAGFWYLLLKLLPTSLVIDTYIQTAFNKLNDHLTNPKASDSMTNFIQGFLKETNEFLVTYNGATESFAKAQNPRGSLAFHQDEAIRANYANKKGTESQEELTQNSRLAKSRALRALCEKFTAAFVDGYAPAVPGFFGLVANKFLRQQIKKYFPPLLQSIVAAGIDYTKPHNIAYSITMKRFFREQFEKLNTSLDENGASSPPPQVSGIELLPTVIAELRKAIRLSGEIQTQDEIKKRANGHFQTADFVNELLENPGEAASSLVPDNLVQPHIQKYLLLGCRHVFHYLSKPANVEQLVGRLLELTTESFSSNQVEATQSVTDFNTRFGTAIQGNQLKDLFGRQPLSPNQTIVVDGVKFTVQSDTSILSFEIERKRHLEIKENAQNVLEEVASSVFKKAIRKGLNEPDPQNLPATLEASLQTHKKISGQVFDSFPAVCQQMRSQLAEEVNIHPEIISLTRRISDLTDDAKLKTQLDAQFKSTAKKQAILRALLPVYKTSAEITKNLKTLQNAQLVLLDIKKQITEQNSRIQILQMGLEPAIKRLQEIKAANVDGLKALSKDIQNKDQILKVVQDLDTLLEPWRLGIPNAFRQNRNTAQINALIDSLPASDDKTVLVDQLKLFFAANLPQERSAQWSNLTFCMNDIRTKRKTEREALIAEAQNLKTVQIEAIRKGPLTILEARKASKIGTIESEIGQIEAAIADIQTKLPNIQTTLQIEWSMTDLATSGIAYLFAPWLGPMAPITAQKLMTSGEQAAKFTIEKIAVAKAEEFFGQAYRFLESSQISHAAATRAMKSFIDS